MIHSSSIFGAVSIGRQKSVITALSFATPSGLPTQPRRQSTPMRTSAYCPSVFPFAGASIQKSSRSVIVSRLPVLDEARDLAENLGRASRRAHNLRDAVTVFVPPYLVLDVLEAVDVPRVALR